MADFSNDSFYPPKHTQALCFAVINLHNLCTITHTYKHTSEFTAETDYRKKNIINGAYYHTFKHTLTHKHADISARCLFSL